MTFSKNYIIITKDIYFTEQFHFYIVNSFTEKQFRLAVKLIIHRTFFISGFEIENLFSVLNLR